MRRAVQDYVQMSWFSCVSSTFRSGSSQLYDRSCKLDSIDTHAVGEYSRPEDTTSSWTNGRKDCVSPPRGCHRGVFFFSSHLQPVNCCTRIDEGPDPNVSPQNQISRYFFRTYCARSRRFPATRVNTRPYILRLAKLSITPLLRFSTIPGFVTRDPFRFPFVHQFLCSSILRCTFWTP